MDTQERNAIIAKLIADGMSLGDVQKTLESEHNIKMTYMELRLLSSELAVDWSKQDAAIQASRPKEKAKAPEASAPQAAPAQTEPDDLDGVAFEDELPDDAMDELDDEEFDEAEPIDAGGPRGKTVVNISKLARPGAVMHGDVTFGSGASAEWYLDQFGRLGLNPAEGSAKPDQQDVQEFQLELQKAVQSQMGGMGGMM